MRRSGPRPISIALDRLGEQLAPQTTLARAQAVWAQAVGPHNAAHSHPAFERGGTLTIDCDQAGWTHELQMQSAHLLEALNSAIAPVAGVRALRFRTR
jgi:predicted nucleic acid-binding Zn ribbon protein